MGIDVSKKTIDAVLHEQNTIKQFSNSVKDFKSLIQWATKQTGLDIDQIIICFEHTGIYSLPLATYLSENKISYAMVPALEIKRSLGLVRGKNDKVDAKRIAEYAFLRREKLKKFEMPAEVILQLQKLLSLRDKMVRQRGAYNAEIKEITTILKNKSHQTVIKAQKKMVTSLSKQISIIEKEIKTLIKQDESISQTYELITSVRGIGFVLAVNLIVATNCFTSFNDSRKFACYAGIAPFEKQSGTSLRSKPRVSHLANKKLKSLLNMAAFSAIQSDPELKLYYLERVLSGKSKMSTMNIIRNKIVHRVFAVVKRGTPYVVLNKHEN